MKKYYLVAEESGKRFDVHLTDVEKGKKVLMEIEAASYDEAAKRISYNLRYAGKDGVLYAANAAIHAEVY